SNHYAAYVASIHLAAIRFCLLVIGKQMQGASTIAQMRQELQQQYRYQLCRQAMAGVQGCH
ncbi:hypothetical protein, partial [Thiolapillus sp.]